MLTEWLRTAETWLPTLDRWHWFTFAWLTMIVALIALELLIPAFGRNPDRSDRWPTNCGLGVVNALLAIAIPVSIIAAAEWAASQGLGLFNQIATPLWLAILASIAVRSLAAYLLHIAFHKLPMLWRVHRVHHLDQHVDVTTSFRSHPVEFAATLITLIGVAVVFGLNPWAIAAYEIADAALNLASHANLRLPERMDRMARWVFVTPNMHCLHHSSFKPETDSNYGTVFSFWDRLFGTYSAAPKAGWETMQFGLDEIRDQRAARFWWQIGSPLLSLPIPPQGDPRRGQHAADIQEPVETKLTGPSF